MKITVLADNQKGCPNFLSEHGLSFYIEKDGFKILFDTGKGKAIGHNIALHKISLKKIDALLLSHGHYDHTGGLKYILKRAPSIKIFAHPSILEKKYSAKNKFHYIGISNLLLKQLKDKKTNITWINKPTQINKNIYATGEIPRLTNFEKTEKNFYLDRNRKRKDPVIDDQALYIKSKIGIVVFLGCAHAGTVNTLNYISKLTKRKTFYAVLGGMHLLGASSKKINLTLRALNKYKVKILAPTHCTGEKASALLSKKFSGKFISLKSGDKLNLR